MDLDCIGAHSDYGTILQQKMMRMIDQLLFVGGHGIVKEMMPSYLKKHRVGARLGLFVASFALLLGLSAALVPAPALAANCLDPGVNQKPDDSNPCRCKDNPINSGNCAPVAYTLLVINILSAIVGLIIVIMIAYGGVQYTMAKDNPQQITEAREKIRNAVLAFLVYLFMFSFLQWVVPGGVF